MIFEWIKTHWFAILEVNWFLSITMFFSTMLWAEAFPEDFQKE